MAAGFMRHAIIKTWNIIWNICGRGMITSNKKKMGMVSVFTFNFSYFTSYLAQIYCQVVLKIVKILTIKWREKMSKIIISQIDNHNIYCYGKIKPNSTFQVDCEDHSKSEIVSDIDTETHDTWESVIDYLENGTDISEIQEVSVI